MTDALMQHPWLAPYLVGVLATVSVAYNSRLDKWHTAAYVAVGLFVWLMIGVGLAELAERYPAPVSARGFGGNLALHAAMLCAWLSITLEGVYLHRAKRWYIGALVVMTATMCAVFYAHFTDRQNLAQLLDVTFAPMQAAVFTSLLFRVRPVYRWCYELIETGIGNYGPFSRRFLLHRESVGTNPVDPRKYRPRRMFRRANLK